MKAFPILHGSILVRTALVAGIVLGSVSCSLPPRQAWQRMKEDGILKAFFVPKRSVLVDDTTQRLAGADLSVEEATGGRPAGPPMAEVADRPGYVYSPRTSPRKLVNVKDFAPGETVLCPYTMEPFVVPTAAASTPRLARTRSSTPTKRGSEAPVRLAENPAVQEVTSEELGDAGLDMPLTPEPSAAPFGTWVENKPGHVYSPFAARHQLVDVTGLVAGSEVHCPFSGRIFRVPETTEAVDSSVPTLPEPELPGSTAPQVAATATAPTDSLPPAPIVADPTTEAMRELAAPAPIPVPSTAAPKYGASRPQAVPPPPAPTDPAAPIEEPAPANAPKPTVPPTPAPTPTPTPTPALPTATWAPNKPGLVQSPFGKPGELVDVTGKPTGTKVVCPYTNKPFLVPAP